MNAGMRLLRTALTATLLLILIPSPLFAQQGFEARRDYSKTELMIPMRDGVELFTAIYEPTDRSRTYPIMLFRTPYGIGNYGPEIRRRTLGPSDLFTRSGYIFVYQDVRGKFRSEGKFEVMNPVYSKLVDPALTDETTDTYDTIQWILDNVPNHEERVGQWGISYPGWQTVMGMIDAHPALVASSPQASPADMYIGDDFHHNGAFRLMYTFGWLAGNAAVRTGPSTERQGARFSFGTPDGYDFFLRLGPVINVDRFYFNGQVPTWNEYMEHGAYDEYWQRQDVLQHMKNIRPAVLNVAGWFDAEDFYGPMSIYYEIEKNDAGNQSILVVGPWRHGGWARGTGESLGDIRFGSNTSEFYRSEVEFPFFEYYLKGRREQELTEAIVFETGSNQWRRYDQWPPAEAQRRNLYLRKGGSLAFDPPSGETAEISDSFVSDPDKPVPWSTETRTSQGHEWMVEDQRFAARRPDVLVYETEPLEEEVVIAGPIIARLQVSTTGTDADWIVKLIDVYPGDTSDDSPHAGTRMGGFQMLVAGEVFRSKFRNGFDRPEPLTPNEVTLIEFDLRDKFHSFRKGHRIMVQIQSTWFPVIDRNPQTFVDIYHAEASDFQKATHTVYRSVSAPSHLELGIIERRNERE
jgi:putative CocE/NonD family hydrolase